MAKIKSKDTRPEKAMIQILHKNGVTNFIKGDKIFGKPDFIFERAKIALFVDGRFWHGYNYSKIKHKLPPFWRQKIAKNIKRDKLVNTRLKREGWKVIRVWDYNVTHNPQTYLQKINKAIK